MEMIGNFRVLSRQPLPEIEATLHLLTHEPTGARLCWIQRASENKTFGITFPTIPEDDTGVFHILEHSVLCGSRRYPVKEPFVELLKGSMQTFLNAFTYPDHTFYPVASRNDKDFLNLMRVYLDAVFFPAIYEKPEIFAQEGWHYELHDGVPSYKGVVFNEMKGVFASPDSIMACEMDKLLFPDTCYRYVSGGDPAAIPELTYEKFLAQHQKYYHPSNAYILFDGSVDLPAVLQVMDEEYLSQFTRRTVDATIPCQAPVAGESTRYYALSPQEDPAGKVRVGYGYGLGSFQNRLEQVAMSAVSEILCGSNFAPLKQALLELCEDVDMGVSDGMQQCYLTLSADNLLQEDVAKFEETTEAILRDQVKNGLDHDHLRAVLANMQLHARQRDYGSWPQGLGFLENVIASWMYGGDPAAFLTVGPLFAELEARVDTGWYEALLEKMVLSNPHRCKVTLLPSHEAEALQRRAEEQRLQKAAASWDEEEILARQQALLTWQSTPDSPEALASIPRLTLADIRRTPEDIPTEAAVCHGVRLLRHRLPTAGIGYRTLYFDISDFSEAELQDASFLCQLLGNLETENLDAARLQQRISYLTGDLSFSVVCYSPENQPQVSRTYLCAAYSALESKAEEAASLVLDILTHTRFADRKELNNILQQCTLAAEQLVVEAGNNVGILRTLAGCCASGVVAECTGGFTFLQYLRDLEGGLEALACRLQAMTARAFTRSRLTLSVTGPQQDAVTERMLPALPEGEKGPFVSSLAPWGVKREGIVIPADTSFAVQCGPVLYSGAGRVAAQAVSLGHLWNAVRVQGGAYGADLVLADRGCASFYTYRDPGSARSLEKFKESAAFLEELADSGADLTPFIIGAVSATEPVLLPGRQGRVADIWYLRGMDFAGRCALRESMLSTTAEDLRAFARALRQVTQTGGVCVVGARDKVLACDLDGILEL